MHHLGWCAVLGAGRRAQAWLPEKGHGSFSVAYQDLYIHYHTDSHGDKSVPGTIDNHSVFLDFDYGLSDRWALSIGLPYKSNRYRGAPHPPVIDDHGENFIDDGDYHDGWANWNLSLRYQWRDGPWAITPFVSYGSPSHDYSTYAHSAFGTGQTRFEVGINTGHRFGPPMQNVYFYGSYGYSMMEVVDHRRVNHSTLTLELSYFLTPRVSARLLMVGQKTHNGLDFPADYPPPRNGDYFFHHDQNVRNDFVNVGVGLNYQHNDRYGLFANYGQTLWGENAHLIDSAVTVGISRNF